MTDPLMPALCCHRPNHWSVFYDMMLEIDSAPYNAICLISSSLGIIGALYQIIPRTGLELANHWYSIISRRGRCIIFWLAFTDLFASLGIFLRSLIKLTTPMMMQLLKRNATYCYLLAFWIQYFFMATWLWTFIYAIDSWLAFKSKPSYFKTYHLLCWIAPAVLTFSGLFILYYPNAGCFSDFDSFWRFFPNHLISYSVLVFIMVANPIIYMRSSALLNFVAAQYSGQFTKKERQVVEVIKIKFALINMTFLVCWLPNIISCILLYTNWYSPPRKTIVSIWYIMAIMNPLQALFNSLVYRRPQDKLWLPWRRVVHPYQDVYNKLNGERRPLLARTSGSSNNCEELQNDYDL